MKAAIVMVRAEIVGGQWRQPGEVVPGVDLAEAERLERIGYALIQSRDGAPEVWASCCTGGDHAHPAEPA